MLSVVRYWMENTTKISPQYYRRIVSLTHLWCDRFVAADSDRICVTKGSSKESIRLKQDTSSPPIRHNEPTSRQLAREPQTRRRNRSTGVSLGRESHRGICNAGASVDRPNRSGWL